MAEPRVFAIVRAGGEGKRLAPLTADRAKPAVPFAAKAERFGRAGRQRAIDHFSRATVAAETVALYQQVLGAAAP